MAYFFQAGVPFSSENAKGTAFSKVHSENINTNPHIFFDSNTWYTNPSSECSISCNKYTIPMQRTATTPTKTASTANIDLRCFVAMQFLSQIYTLFWRTIYRSKSAVAYKNDKYQVYAVFISTKMANKNLEVMRFQFWFWLHIFIHGERSYFGLRGRFWLSEGSAGAKIDLLQIGSTSSFPVPVEREQSIRVLHSTSGPFSSQFSFGCF